MVLKNWLSKKVVNMDYLIDLLNELTDDLTGHGNNPDDYTAHGNDVI